MIKLSEPARTYRDKDGHIREELSVEDSKYNEIVLQRLGDDKLALRATTKGGESESYLLRNTKLSFLGLEHIEGDRRDIPEDLQDALQPLGFTAQANLVDDDEAP